jgi:uncharacterized repeat protein (TIGR01451 family)
MKIFSSLRMFALLALGLMVVATRLQAQSVGLSVVASPSPVAVSNSLTYTITVTNLTLITENFIITNTLPASAQFQSASNPYGTYANNGNIVIFLVPGLAYGGVVQTSVTAMPTAAGLMTDSVTVISGDLVYSASTSVGTQVTNTVVQQADLAVGMTVPTSAVYTNDWMVYGVSVTNSGPDTAPGIFLTNTLPPGVGYKSVSPALKNLGSGSNVVFSLGTLASGAFTNLYLTVQPTNAGVLPFSSFVNSSSVTDTNLANNTATTNITVNNYFPANLVAYTNSAQKYNLQNNLVEQSVLLTNQGTNDVDSARIVVSGLAKTNVLFNAVGTNNGNPFVVYGTSLAAGQSVGLLLQFAADNYFPFTNSQLQAFAVSPPNLTPPPVVTVSTNLNITRIVRLSSGDMLIWFPSITNRTYTVVYSSDLLSTNWLAAQPSVVAPANDTEWIDYGPPGTLSHPTNNTPVRFYRVFLNP